MDNPFVGKAGFRPGIYSYGHRNFTGPVRFHPETGVLWEDRARSAGRRRTEYHPRPVRTTAGRSSLSAANTRVTIITNQPWREGMEQPGDDLGASIGLLGVWSSTSGEAFPGDGRATCSSAARQPGTLNEVVFAPGGPIGRESLLADLKQRVRDVRQGPDGLLYVVTDAEPRRDPAYRADTEIDFVGERWTVSYPSTTEDAGTRVRSSVHRGRSAYSSPFYTRLEYGQHMNEGVWYAVCAVRLLGTLSHLLEATGSSSRPSS